MKPENDNKKNKLMLSSKQHRYLKIILFPLFVFLVVFSAYLIRSFVSSEEVSSQIKKGNLSGTSDLGSFCRDYFFNNKDFQLKDGTYQKADRIDVIEEKEESRYSGSYGFVALTVYLKDTKYLVLVFTKKETKEWEIYRVEYFDEGEVWFKKGVLIMSENKKEIKAEDFISSQSADTSRSKPILKLIIYFVLLFLLIVFIFFLVNLARNYFTGGLKTEFSLSHYSSVSNLGKNLLKDKIYTYTDNDTLFPKSSLVEEIIPVEDYVFSSDSNTYAFLSYRLKLQSGVCLFVVLKVKKEGGDYSVYEKHIYDEIPGNLNWFNL